MLTHCFQGLYYLLRHPGFMGWAARRRPGLGVGGQERGFRLVGVGGRMVHAGRQPLIYRKPSGGNKCCNRGGRPTRQHGSPANAALGRDPPPLSSPHRTTPHPHTPFPNFSVLWQLIVF